MSKRIKSAREILFQKMRELGTPGNWEHIVKHCGMFTFTGLKRTYCYTERNVTDLMQVVNVYRLDACLSLTCIVSLFASSSCTKYVKITLYATLYLQTCSKLLKQQLTSNLWVDRHPGCTVCKVRGEDNSNDH